ncbi:hypothetical protein [Nakamurella aerolata]|uniref:Uncharacterized protein n=1 Tax=Nakamurella aerolata TaxID=1656892 RepID=A0A849AHF3_9ACTN|nr:hypothetical protein [Nakamurella aerolata]NNG36272.1 hypothetical protein [Nakamurella aerolata]
MKHRQLAVPDLVRVVQMGKLVGAENGLQNDRQHQLSGHHGQRYRPTEPKNLAPAQKHHRHRSGAAVRPPRRRPGLLVAALVGQLLVR